MSTLQELENYVAGSIRQRMTAAETRYGAFASTHEAMGVALEEWSELIEAVRSNKLGSVESEALDLAAVCIRLAMACAAGGEFSSRSVK